MDKFETRASLAQAVSRAYSPSSFPGSRAWLICNKAEKALDAFDAANPEVLAEMKAAKKAADEARWAGQSDFVKNGS